MGGRDQRAGLGRWIRAGTQPDQLRATADLGHEPVVDLVLDDLAATGRAHLAGMDEGGSQRVVDDRLEIGVGEDDLGALAAELEGDSLDVPRGTAKKRASGVETAGQ